MVINLAGAAANVASNLTGGLIKGSSTPASNAYTDQVSGQVQSGNQDALDILVRRAGYGGPGAPGSAVGKGGPYGDAKSYAQSKLASFVAQGTVIADLQGVPLNRDRGVSQFPDLPYDNPNMVGRFKIANASKAANPQQDRAAPPPLATSNPSWLTLGLVGVGGFLVFKMLKRGG